MLTLLISYLYYSFWVLVTVIPLAFLVVCRSRPGSLSMIARMAGMPRSQCLLLVLQPFIDKGQPVLRLFPDRYYAIAVPVFAGVVLWSATLVTLGCFLINSEVCK